MNKKTITYLIHIPIWGIIFYLIFNNNDDLGATTFRLTSTLLNVSSFAAIFYFYFSFLVPVFLEKKRYILFVLYSILFIGIMPIIMMALNEANFQLLGNPEKISIYRLRSFGITMLGWGGGAQGTLFIALLGILYRFITDWFRNIEEKKELESKNLQSELRMLKSKLNPHLLFNTLNNIDSFIHTSPEKASKLLLELSDMLRYVVYDTEKEYISITEEVDLLNTYIKLEKIRLVNPDSVTFNTEINGEIQVPPMIFFPFVENSFKHSNLNRENHKICISITGNNGLIAFECVNHVMEKQQHSGYNGMGLELAKRRLDLLFPNKHQLIVRQEENEFSVKLQIKIN